MSPAEGVGDVLPEFHIIPLPSPPPPTSPPPSPPSLPPHILILGGSDQQSVFLHTGAHILNAVANYLNKYLKRNSF